MIARSHSGPTGVLIHRFFARYQENAAIINDSEKMISVIIKMLKFECKNSVC